MGHVCGILEFPEKTPKGVIERECDEWARANGSHGVPDPIRYRNLTFGCYDDAAEYLEKTFGNYSEFAVKYEKRPEPKRTKALDALEAKIDDARKAMRALDAPHYAGVKQATVKCKACGSSLATKFCGKSFRNACPVCGNDLRPESALAKLRRKKAEVEELEKKYREETRKAQAKSSAKPEIWWAVGCEAHI